MSDYNTDLVTWSDHQAALLRRMGAGERVNDQVDWENVAEEIEALGRSDRRELRSRVRTIMVHVIKLQVSPATEPRIGWRQTIVRERVDASTLIEESPSLRRLLPDLVAHELPTACALAVTDLASYGAHPSIDPATVNLTVDQVLGPWMPDDEGPR